jgi:hypothetical protein
VRTVVTMPAVSGSSAATAQRYSVARIPSEGRWAPLRRAAARAESIGAAHIVLVAASHIDVKRSRSRTSSTWC